MESSSYWLLFLSAAIAINITPGPDMIYILSRTIAQGRKIGIASSFGVCSGALVHIIAAAFGLSAILATSAMAFGVVKYVGAAYLIYLGIQALKSKRISFDIPVTILFNVPPTVVTTLPPIVFVTLPSIVSITFPVKSTVIPPVDFFGDLKRGLRF